MKLKGFLAVAAVALAVPALGHADKPAHAGQKGPRGHAAAQPKATPAGAQTRDRRGEVVLVRDERAPCPPGLAKKSPACVPPGQARPRLVGRVVDWRDVHLVRKPGLYGLAQAPSGQNYAIIDGRLVRIESRTAKILSVIRTVDAILD